MPIIGTAGHVDHGKSTLVKALTGRDPDRWAEEKARGLTIDLGFAWTELAEGVVAGFVDVPGHERFMKNMLAGVGALDVALLVVAADEGWMPQTEEHAAVLDLLEIGHGVIALTRSDLADADTMELVQLEVAERVEGTTLESWPVVATSALTGDGLDRLTSALVSALEESGGPVDTGRPRLWVDRSFVISGAGAVVTGTLTGGSIGKGQSMELFPGRRPVRIRTLQSHEQEVETSPPGTRTALNLAGIERREIERGALIAASGQARESNRFLANVRTIRSVDTELTARGAYHLHAGSGSWPMRLRPLTAKGILGAGAALLSVDEPLPLRCGDRFIIREVGRRAVVGGGRILDPAPAGSIGRLRSTSAALAAALGEGANAVADALLDARDIETLANLEIDSGGGEPTIALVAGDLALSQAAARRIATSTVELVRAYQVDNPLRTGMPKASVASALDVPPGALQAVVDTTPGLVDDGATLHTDDFASDLGPAEEEAWKQAESTLRASGHGVPRSSQLGLGPELLHSLIRSGKVIRVADDLVYLPEQIDAIVAALGRFDEPFSVAEFRDALEVTRRHAVPLLEWLDAAGHTVRRGDVRSLRKPPGPAGSDARPR